MPPNGPQATFHAPWLVDYDTVSFTFSAHGVEPSVIVVNTYRESLRSLPSTPFRCELRYDTIVRTFPDCLIDSSATTFGENGNRATLRILDHRWRWKNHAKGFSIHANRRVGKKIKDETKKSARFIAGELLKAAGELRTDIGLVPDNDYPEIEVTGSNPPMVELQELVSRYGLRVCYVPQSGLVKIVRPGQGATLPITPWLAYPSFTFNPPELPDKVLVLGGHLIVQCRWKLKAMAEEYDGSIVPEDDATYMPTDGWKTQYPESMSGVQTDFYKRLALKSVKRYYQIDRSEDTKDGATVLVKFLEQLKDRDGKPIQITSLDQVLPLFGQLADTETLPDQSVQAKRAVIRGKWYQEKIETRDSQQNTDGSTKDPDAYPGGWSLDGDRGLVIFAEPVYLFDREDKQDGPIKPAELTLECTFHIRVKVLDSPLRPVYEMQVSNTGAGFRTFTRDELRRVVKFSNSKLDDGVAEFEAEAQIAAAEILSGIQTEAGAVGLYNRIEPIDPDGAIPQLQYNVGDSGGTTLASRNMESSLVTPAYAVRRRIAADNAKLEQ